MLKYGSSVALVATTAAMCTLGGHVHAQLAEVGVIEPDAVHSDDASAGRSMVGLAVGIAPDYEGSDVYEFGLVPFARIGFGPHQQYLQLSPDPGSRTYQARVNLSPYDAIEIGPMLDYRRGRKHVGNKSVRTLPNIDNGAELGGFVRWKVPLGLARQSLALELSGAADVTGAYEGWWIQPGVRYRAGITEAVSVSGRVFADYADDNYMGEFFSISAGQAARSGLSTKDADAGFKDVGVALGVNWQFAQHWFTGLSVTYERMIGDAASSPVTRSAGDKNQAFGGAYVGYRF